MSIHENRIRVLLVDDHPIILDGLRALPHLDKRIEIVGEASSMIEAILSNRSTKPDVILMDVRLPDGSGIEACREIKASSPGTRVLFLTSCADSGSILAAMECGADGYLLKENNARRIIEAIHVALADGAIFDEAPASNETEETDRDSALLRLLTPQEKRVMEEVAAGKTDKEISVALGLSAKTVRNYLDRVFAKWQVKTRTQAAIMFTGRAL